MIDIRSPVEISGQTERSFETAHNFAATTLLSFEYCELRPGRLSSFTSELHGILVPSQSNEIHAVNTSYGRRRRLKLKDDELIVVPAGTVTAWQWQSFIKIIMIWIEPRVLWEFIENQMKSLVVGRIIGGKTKLRDPDLVRIAHELKSAAEHKEIGDQVMLDSLSRIFLVTLVRNHSETQTASMDTVGSRLSVDQFRRLVAFIDSNLTEKITVSEMASAIGMRANILSRDLRDAIGETPAAFLLRSRLQKAREMVVSTPASLTQIAYRCGFADQAHMSRAFKKRYGLPPRIYRRKSGTTVAQVGGRGTSAV